MSTAKPLSRLKRLTNYRRQNDRFYRTTRPRPLTVAQTRQLRKTDLRRDHASEVTE